MKHAQRREARYALLAPTSMGLRLTPQDRQPLATSQTFALQVTSAESNVLQIAASLGLPVKILTALVEDSPMAAQIEQGLRARQLSYEAMRVAAGGPWGYRHQINMADSGYGLRAPRVYNDRAGEVGRLLTAEAFDLQRLLVEEGAKVVHISGLVAALSEASLAFCLTLAQKAKAAGSLISFDLNHRASFWKGREQELRPGFQALAELADILIGNEEDYQLALGLPGPELPENQSILPGSSAKGTAREAQLQVDAFCDMMQRVRAAYPGAKILANTLRQVHSANRHDWGALLDVEGRLYVEQPRPIEVYDRIGGGDAFVGGLLYAIVSQQAEADWIRLAWAAGALAVTTEKDYLMPQSLDELWAAYRGQARVLR